MICYYLARFPDDLEFIYAAHPKLRAYTQSPSNSQRQLENTDSVDDIRPTLKRKINFDVEESDEDSQTQGDEFINQKGKKVNAQKGVKILKRCVIFSLF